MIKRLFLVVASAMAVIGAWQAIDIPKARALCCCTYGVDCVSCGTNLKCCKPGIGQAPCSQDKGNYCVSACPQL